MEAGHDTTHVAKHRRKSLRGSIAKSGAGHGRALATKPHHRYPHYYCTCSSCLGPLSNTTTTGWGLIIRRARQRHTTRRQDNNTTRDHQSEQKHVNNKHGNKCSCASHAAHHHNHHHHEPAGSGLAHAPAGSGLAHALIIIAIIIISTSGHAIVNIIVIIIIIMSLWLLPHINLASRLRRIQIKPWNCLLQKPLSQSMRSFVFTGGVHSEMDSSLNLSCATPCQQARHRRENARTPKPYKQQARD